MTPQSMTEGETNNLAETIRHNASWRVKDVQPGMVQIENRETGYGVQIYTRQQWEAIVKQTETGDIVNDFQDIAITLVARLDEQVNSLTAKIEAIMAEAANLETQQKTLLAKREAILNGADAATGLHIDTTSPYQVRPAPQPVTLREAQRTGTNPMPGNKTQREWVIEQFNARGTATIADLAAELVKAAAENGVTITLERAYHNVSSIMSYLIKYDKTVLRMRAGVYKKAELTSEADGA